MKTLIAAFAVLALTSGSFAMGSLKAVRCSSTGTTCENPDSNTSGKKTSAPQSNQAKGQDHDHK